MKKGLAYLLLVLIIAANMTGCDGQTAKKPVGKEVPTLVWYVPGDQQNDLALINEEASRITKEKIGVNIELKFIDTGAYQERMNMNMASSAEFDLCFVGYLYSYQKAVDMGGLMEIGSLLDKYAKDVMEQMPDYVMKAIKTENGIYAVPNQQIMAFGAGRYIRSDLVKKYNIDVDSIKYIEDLEGTLVKIRDNEPELVPSIRINSNTFRKNADTHYITVNGSTILLNDKDNKVVTYYEIPGTYEAAQKSYDWYKKGFYRSDLATNISSGEGDSYYRAGRYATISTTYKPGVDGEIKAGTGYDYTLLYKDESIMGHTSPIETCIAVSRTTKYPEQAVKFINLINTDKELYNLLCFGIKDKHYKAVDENHIKIIPESNYIPNASWKFGNQFNAYLTEGQKDDVWEKTKELNDKSIKSPIIGIFFNTDDIRTELTQVAKVQSEYLDARINTGVEDPATYWDDYVAKMKYAGIEKVKECYQKQIDDYLKK